jgi:hypothetical protein
MPSSLSAPPSQGITAENSNQKRSRIPAPEQWRPTATDIDAASGEAAQLPLPPSINDGWHAYQLPAAKLVESKF